MSKVIDGIIAKAQAGYKRIVLAEGEDMKNTYSLIAVNPEKIEGLNTEGAKAFIDWMLGEEAGALIAKYGEAEYGSALFTLIEK